MRFGGGTGSFVALGMISTSPVTCYGTPGRMSRETGSVLAMGEGDMCYKPIARRYAPQANSEYTQMKNPLLQQIHQHQLVKMEKYFLNGPIQSPNNHLSFYKYISSIPQKFYSRDGFLVYLQEIERIDRKHRSKLCDYLQENRTEINNAFRNAKEINDLSWHDEKFESESDYETLILIDQTINPAYLRLIEAIYQPMVRILAFFSRIESGKSTDGLNLFQTVSELSDDLFKVIKAPYEHIMRNGIAHGGIIYSTKGVIFRDSKKNEALFSHRQVIRIFDDMLDVCNGILFAYSVFSLSHSDRRELIPQDLLNEEIHYNTNTPYWEVKGLLQSTQITGRSQLNIYCSARTNDDNKVRFSAIQTAILAERYAPGYSCYYLSMRGINGFPGFARFDGEKLASHRLQNHGVEKYSDAVQEYLPLFLANNKTPRLFHRLESLKYAFELTYPAIISDFHQITKRPEIQVRNSSIHRTRWGAVLNADIVIESPDSIIDQNVIKHNCRILIKKALSNARRKTPLSSIARYLPLGFARIDIFCSDYRARRLNGFGLGEDMIGTVSFLRIGGVNPPDIYGSTIENYRKYRIAWNKRWMERDRK
jgi:hypothetical protein